MSLQHWINDGLMAVFFLLAGLEIKRELLIGELASIRRGKSSSGGRDRRDDRSGTGLRRRSTPAARSASGWGIPMATDIAFAAGVFFTLVGKALPASIKVLVLAIAIVDDLGAVLVIALFYTSHVSAIGLAVAGAFLAVLILLNLLGIHHTFPYIAIGLGLWAATFASGIVHATVASVLLGSSRSRHCAADTRKRLYM